MKRLFLLFTLTSIYYFSFSQKASNDSIPKEKVFTLTMPESKIRGKIDTFNYVIRYVGKSLTVDEAEKLQAAFFTAWNSLIGQFKEEQIPAKPKNK